MVSLNYLRTVDTMDDMMVYDLPRSGSGKALWALWACEALTRRAVSLAMAPASNKIGDTVSLKTR